MWRRLNREELAATNPLSYLSKEEDPDTFTWSVYEAYDFKSSAEGPYLTVKEGAQTEKVYEPLLETPHLFLEFARLGESKNGRALFAWLYEYGLLGLHTSRLWQFRGTDESLLRPAFEYDAKGGPSETFDNVVYEAKAANHALRLYEAALSRDENKLEEAIFDDQYWEKKEVQILFGLRAKITGGNRLDTLVDAAVQALSIQMNEVLSAFAYPRTTFGLSDDSLTPKKPLNPGALTASLWPRNLLGAMYLQFYWLITSGGELSRCTFCRRFISFAPPAPGGKERKVRKDKQFCDHRCRQNHHYHTKVKPGRRRNENA